jgi:molecular chaperone HtpG
MVSLNSNAEKFAEEAHNLPKFKIFSLPGIKENIANLLDMIGREKGIFSTYTKHDISHVDEMLNMLDWLVPPSTQKEMTPVDWLLTTLSIYLHDLGMVVTREEYESRMNNTKFREFLESLEKDADGKDYLARTEKMSPDEKDVFFYQEFIRKQHATRIREWITGRHSSHWGLAVKPIADEIAKILENLHPRFRENLATVCESHHKDDLNKPAFFPLCQRYGSDPKELANVQYSALLLRTADLLHVTSDRTPSVMYKIIHISDPKGVEAWQKHIGTFSVNMKPREFDPEDTGSHIIVVGADFTEEKPFFG